MGYTNNQPEIIPDNFSKLKNINKIAIDLVISLKKNLDSNFTIWFNTLKKKSTFEFLVYGIKSKLIIVYIKEVNKKIIKENFLKVKKEIFCLESELNKNNINKIKLYTLFLLTGENNNFIELNKESDNFYFFRNIRDLEKAILKLVNNLSDIKEKNINKESIKKSNKKDFLNLKKYVAPESCIMLNNKNIVLDNIQENVLKKLIKGDYIIRGVAGSGKTLLISMAAVYKAILHPDWKILITCYNITLIEYIKEIINSMFRSLNIKKEFYSNNFYNIDIIHFHRLAFNFFKFSNEQNFNEFFEDSNVKLEFNDKKIKLNEIEELKDEVLSEKLGKKLEDIISSFFPEKYNAIFIDEAQDFHTTWLKALKKLLDTNGVFVLAEDPNQKVYPRKLIYKEANINVIGRGKVFHLPFAYRADEAIVKFASYIALRNEKKLRKYFDNEVQIEDYNVFILSEKKNIVSENYNKINIYDNIFYLNRLTELLLKNIKEDLETFKLNRSSIAIIYFPLLYLDKSKYYPIKDHIDNSDFNKNNNFEKVNYFFIKYLFKKLSESHKVIWLTKNRETKQNFKIDKWDIVISTPFSIKGFEFDSVHFIGLENYPWKLRTDSINRSIIYTVITRARFKISLYSLEENKIVKEMKKILKEIKKIL